MGMRGRPALALSAAVMLAGCGGAESLSPAEIAGTYLLVEVDGQPLPVSGSYQGQQYTVTAGHITLNPDRGGSLSTTFVQNPDPVVWSVTWLLRGSELNLTFDAQVFVDTHFDIPVENGEFGLTMQDGDILPPGTYRYRRGS